MLSCSLRNFGRQNGNLSDIPSAENLISLGPTSKGMTLSVGTSTGTSSPVAVSGTDISEAPTPTTPITSETSKLPTASIVVASDMPTESSVTLPFTSVLPVLLIASVILLVRSFLESYVTSLLRVLVFLKSDNPHQTYL